MTNNNMHVMELEAEIAKLKQENCELKLALDDKNVEISDLREFIRGRYRDSEQILGG